MGLGQTPPVNGRTNVSLRPRSVPQACTASSAGPGQVLRAPPGGLLAHRAGWCPQAQAEALQLMLCALGKPLTLSGYYFRGEGNCEPLSVVCVQRPRHDRSAWPGPDGGSWSPAASLRPVPSPWEMLGLFPGDREGPRRVKARAPGPECSAWSPSWSPGLEGDTGRGQSCDKLLRVATAEVGRDPGQSGRQPGMDRKGRTGGPDGRAW